jgi:DNA-binding IclR family transcriptional regulator
VSVEDAAQQRGHGLRRDIDLLEALASAEAQRRGGLGVVRLAELTGREKSQVSRALKALGEAGIVERDPASLEYQLGWRLFSLVARTAENRLSRVAEPVMRELSAELEESSHLCILRDTQVLTLLSVSPGHAFRTQGWEGRSIPAAYTSAGRVLLADATPDELYVRFGTVEDLAPDRPNAAAHTIAQLWVLITRAAEQGYALVDEEFEDGLVGVSAPIRDFRGRVIAAINISAPKDRFGTRLHEGGKITARAAASVSAQLGWEPRSGPPNVPKIS